jgi:hypothetical protein
MRTKRTVQVVLILSLAGWLLCSPAGVRAEDDANVREVMAYVITTWDEDCDGSRRNEWDNMVSAWYNDIRNDDALPDGHGVGAAWIIAFMNNDGYISDGQFVDPDNQAWGNDVNHADLPDAFMAGLHGGNDGGDHRWYGKVKFDEAGSGNCFAYQGHIELGDGDLEFLHLSSCYSMDREDWWNEWNSSFDGLHQIDGFHGLMWIGEDYRARYRHFSDDSFWISIADSWLDNLYAEDASNGYDQCPVARNVGTDDDDSLTRMNNERYNAIYWVDPPGLGSDRRHRARYIRGCDPQGKEALPQ